jgi:hypothetical protein
MIVWMLRVLALLCSLALLLAPFGPAQAEPACAMVAAATTHSAHGADHQMPASGHPAETCKQLCAVVAILAPPQPDAARFAFVRPSPTPAARLLDQPPPGPFERPPKLLV